MEQKKRYANAGKYEQKLKNVMRRLGIEQFKYDFGRFTAFVTFTYKGQQYRFDDDVEKARAHKQKIYLGSDCFAQLVLTLEDLARAHEKGIYDFANFIGDMKLLPGASEDTKTPDFFEKLGFDGIPENADAVKSRFRMLAKAIHPDAGGSSELFASYNDAYEKALKYFEGMNRADA